MSAHEARSVSVTSVLASPPKLTGFSIYCQQLRFERPTLR